MRAARRKVRGGHWKGLCQCYWYPLYAYARRKGRQPADAEDVTQGFLAELLAKDRLAAVHPSKGRFRTFLLTCFDHYLCDVRDREAALKRGGGRRILSLDWEQAESRYAYEPVDNRTPEMLFEKAWAMQVLTRALHRLREQWAEAGKEAAFAELRVFLTGDAERGDARDSAARLGMSEGAMRTAINRLRGQYRELLRAEICETVAGDREAVDAEYQHVAEVLRNVCG
ncbi:MAG: RNA polymerase subunit sigma-24 [Verrucomicrobiales bacterium]